MNTRISKFAQILLLAAAMLAAMAAPAEAGVKRKGYTEYKGKMHILLASPTNWNASYTVEYDAVAWVYDNGNLIVWSPNGLMREGAPYISTFHSRWNMIYGKSPEKGAPKNQLYTFRNHVPTLSTNFWDFAANSLSSKGQPTALHAKNVWDWSSTLEPYWFNPGSTIFITRNKKDVLDILCNPPPATSSSWYMAQDLLPRYFAGHVKQIFMRLK